MLRKLFLIFLIVSSCKNENNLKSITLSGVINSNQNLDTIYLKTHSRFYLTSQEKLNYKIPINSKGEFSLDSIIQKGYYELFVDDKTISLFFKQEFNLNIEINNSNIKIKGKGATENLYLQEKKDLESRLASINYYQYFSHLSENEFLMLADSIKMLRSDLIYKYKLPNEDFKFLEESYVEIDRAHKFIKYPFTREMNDTNYVPSVKYPDYFKNLNINDERLIEIPLFNMLLWSDVQLRSQALKNLTYDRSLNALRLAVSDKSIITNTTVKEQLIFTIANFSMEHTDSLDLFYKTFEDFTKNKNNLSKIIAKYHSLKGLGKGNNLPDFKFYDKNDKLVSLESLKGNVLFIDVWATWCKPCIKEIKPSNKLQAKLLDKNIKFVNICIESKKDSWLGIINDNEFNGINLFCPKEKEEEFKRNYLIESLPRYIIVDKNGIIYDFNAKEPSAKESEYELIKLL